MSQSVEPKTTDDKPDGDIKECRLDKLETRQHPRNDPPASLPPSVLPNIWFCLSSAQHDLTQMPLVCKEWRDVFQGNPAVVQWFHQQLLLENEPHAVLLDTRKKNTDKLKRLYLERRTLIQDDLTSLWLHADSASFRQSQRMGKYSRWTLDPAFDDPQFIVDLVWAVRVLSCLGPQAYHVVDGAEHFPYDPRNSMRANDTSPGWRLISLHHYLEMPDDLLEQLLFDPHHEYAGLFMLQHIVEPRSRRRQWQNHPRVVETALERNPDLVHHTNWQRAMDLEEHTKLLRFLVNHPNALRGLFWDANGLVCRDVARLAKEDPSCRWCSPSDDVSSFELQLVHDRTASPHPRQLPHLFNLFKLAKHVEENY